MTWLKIISISLTLGYLLKRFWTYERFPRFLLVIDCYLLFVQLVAIGLVGVVGVGMVVRL
ncbi:hypothetical protein ABID29_002038 [Streptococcus rupicaprae]|uniref:Uncharacterized protein n=1 Tax=Streptococcus rupicaprae TaxID=759619 RepID=A0ABV2FJZ7_9STRE